MIEIWDGQTDLIPLAEAWVKECDIDIDMNCVAEDLDLMLRSPNADVIVMSEGSRVVGAMGITIQNISHTKELHSAERYWYILPKWRAWAKELVNYAKQWSREKGCVKMMIGSSKLSLSCGDFYKAMGFEEYETIYIGDL